MHAFADESVRVLKKQRLCAAQIDAQLGFLLEETAIARRQLVDKQDEFRRKKSQRASTTSSSPTLHSDTNAQVQGSTQAPTPSAAAVAHESHADSNDEHKESEQSDAQLYTQNDSSSHTDANNDAMPAASGAVSSSKSRVFAEEEDSEVDNILQGFIHRVQLLHVEQNVSNELRTIHVALSKYAKQLDKTFSNDVARVCRSTKPLDEALVSRFVVEFLYHDGQIDAADAICQEANVVLSPNYRLCFVELHAMRDALATRDMAPALAWARKYRAQLQQQHIPIEFALVRLQYVELLASSAAAVDALAFATDAFAQFHDAHAKEIHRLMGCLVFKDRLDASPYKDLFVATRWDDMRTLLTRACCQLHAVPFQSYLDTCLSAGISALPAMRKLVTVMESKLTNWASLEELPVEIPIANDLRFHTVFCCPVSKEESAPGNPPVLLKCGHAICKACVKRISFNMTRRFKCPTCPAEMMESETRELFF